MTIPSTSELNVDDFREEGDGSIAIKGARSHVLGLPGVNQNSLSPRQLAGVASAPVTGLRAAINETVFQLGRLARLVAVQLATPAHQTTRRPQDVDRSQPNRSWRRSSSARSEGSVAEPTTSKQVQPKFDPAGVKPRLSIRTILHPTDQSDCAEYARGVASSVAQDQGARLVVLHVAPSHVIYAGPDNGPEPARPQLDAIVSEYRELLIKSDTSTEIYVREGDAAAAILALADEIGADLIVMGAMGCSQRQSHHLGTVAAEIIRTAPIPVLTVRKPRDLPALQASEPKRNEGQIDPSAPSDRSVAPVPDLVDSTMEEEPNG